MGRKEVKVTFRTITPLWTGDAWQKNREIRPSSLIGSLRFWFEVICYFSNIVNEKNFDQKNGEFCLGNFPESEFRLFFIDTSLKTSVEPILRKAKDEHLYEFDYILPAPKKEFKKTLNDKGFKDNLFWIGLIAIEKKTAEEATKNFLKKGLKIFIGGDTRYGFGELELIKLKKINEETNGNEFKQWNIDKDGKFVKNGKDDNSDDKGLKNYFQFFKNDLKFKGELVLLPEFNFTQNVPLVEKAEFFITPGSLIIDDSFDGRSFTLKKGKFQQINQEDL